MGLHIKYDDFLENHDCGEEVEKIHQVKNSAKDQSVFVIVNASNNENTCGFKVDPLPRTSRTEASKDD